MPTSVIEHIRRVAGDGLGLRDGVRDSAGDCLLAALPRRQVADDESDRATRGDRVAREEEEAERDAENEVEEEDQ